MAMKQPDPTWRLRRLGRCLGHRLGRRSGRLRIPGGYGRPAALLLLAVVLGGLGVWAGWRGWSKRGFAGAAPAVGDVAPDFMLRSPTGQEYHLHAHLGRRPIVLEFGSFT